jgi:predicted RNase H-like nuclease (RuvC/YqgF family)
MKQLGNSGKALTFILIVFVVLLVSLLGIAGFHLLKEIDKSQAAENTVVQLRAVEAKLNEDLKIAQEQIVLLEGKKKDAETTIEDLQRDVDFEKGAKEELKKQNQVFQDNLEKEVQAKEDIRSRLTQDLQAAQDKYNSIKSELDKALARNKELENAKLAVAVQMENAPSMLVEQGAMSEVNANANANANASGIDLEKIIVNPAPKGRGKIISVDSDTDFVIVSLGEKDGVVKGSLLSVFRGNDYLGDIKVSRVLAEMSAADFVPPFKSQSVKKDDQVVPKK